MSIFALLLHHTCAFQVNFRDCSFCYFSKYLKLSLLGIHSTLYPASPSSAFVSWSVLHPHSPLDPGARIECAAKVGVGVSCSLWPKLLCAALVCSGWNHQRGGVWISPENERSLSTVFQLFSVPSFPRCFRSYFSSDPLLSELTLRWECAEPAPESADHWARLSGSSTRGHWTLQQTQVYFTFLFSNFMFQLQFVVNIILYSFQVHSIVMRQSYPLQSDPSPMFPVPTWHGTELLQYYWLYFLCWSQHKYVKPEIFRISGLNKYAETFVWRVPEMLP